MAIDTLTDATDPDLNREQKPLVFAVESAARELGLSRTTIFEEIATGRLKSFKVGSRRLIPMASLEEYVADRMAEGTQ